jgi:hypothetical protein
VIQSDIQWNIVIFFFVIIITFHNTCFSGLMWLLIVVRYALLRIQFDAFDESSERCLQSPLIPHSA